MLTPSRLTRLTLTLTLIALGALSGCGKASPLQRDSALVDDALTRAPIQNARQSVADQVQRARDAETRSPETTKVGAPGDDTGG